LEELAFQKLRKGVGESNPGKADRARFAAVGNARMMIFYLRMKL